MKLRQEEILLSGFDTTDSLKARQVFYTGSDLSCLGRQLLDQLQRPPEGLVLPQEGLLG